MTERGVDGSVDRARLFLARLGERPREVGELVVGERVKPVGQRLAELLSHGLESVVTHRAVILGARTTGRYGQTMRADHLARGRRIALVLAAAGVALVLGSAGDALSAPADGTYVSAVCSKSDPATESCKSGGGTKSPGGSGTGKVSHAGWPAIDGVYWSVFDDARGKHHLAGGTATDELLGHHGNDTISGGDGNDVLWADWDPSHNTTKQRDRLSGGAGNDFLYASHGRNTLKGGAGKDLLYAYYGHGTVDCGAGAHDTARVRMNGAYKVRNCETIRHFCTFGSNPDGSCKKPSAVRVRVRVRS